MCVCPAAKLRSSFSDKCKLVASVCPKQGQGSPQVMIYVRGVLKEAVHWRDVFGCFPLLGDYCCSGKAMCSQKVREGWVPSVILSTAAALCSKIYAYKK